MEKKDYPALYSSADSASNVLQKNLLSSYRINAYLLISGVIFTFFNSLQSILPLLSLIAFLGSLSITILLKYKNYEKTWYQARALAESIKTSTWRFMMCADPFDLDIDKSTVSFGALLNELLNENEGITKYLDIDPTNNEQVTQKMIEISGKSYNYKREIYLKDRINEQLKWYSKKSKENKKHANFWFGALCLFYGLTIFMSLIKINNPNIESLPIEVFAICASSIIGWTQIKRYDTLSETYNFASHEISIIKSRYVGVNNKDNLSDFVSDAENAFSREHTQWAARRDRFV